MNRIEFSVEAYRLEWGKWDAVVPIVDGISLVNSVHDFEVAQGFDVPGSYGGIEPSSGDAARWSRYLLGEVYPEGGESSNGTTWLLGCSCGVAGCWPLEARVSAARDTVTWDRFRQPHRPARDYTAFGPFVFARDEYDRAIKGLVATLATGSAR